MSVNPGQNGLASDINNIGHFVAGEAISSGDAVSLNYADYKIYKASAAAFDHRLNFIGFAMAAAALNAAVSVNVLNVHTTTGLTANTIYYLSNTQGAIGTAAGTYERIIGRAVSTTKLIRKRGVVNSNQIDLSRNFTYTAPTHLQLLFNGQNTASSGNRFVLNGVSYHSDGTGSAILWAGMTFEHDTPGGTQTAVYLLDFSGFY